MIAEEVTCPLGSKCYEIKNNIPHRCAWHTKLIGKNPQTLEDINEYACAIAWMPLLQTQVAKEAHGTMESVISLRESTLEKQNMALNLVNNLRYIDGAQ